MSVHASVERLETSAYRIPTAAPEADAAVAGRLVGAGISRVNVPGGTEGWPDPACLL